MWTHKMHKFAGLLMYALLAGGYMQLKLTAIGDNRGHFQLVRNTNKRLRFLGVYMRSEGLTH